MQGQHSSAEMMFKSMPVDLVLVRHGESESNLAQKLALRGHIQAWSDEFRKRHNSRCRLTDRGRHQAVKAGEWIKRHIGNYFDVYLTSEYVRAMETAAHLALPSASWRTEFYLRERDRGVLANMPKQERHAEFPGEREQQAKKDLTLS